MINELEGHVLRMFRDYSDEAGFWLWFSGEADSMRRIANSTEERHYVCVRMNEMLQRTGVARQLVG
jgi:hypothetical protein